MTITEKQLDDLCRARRLLSQAAWDNPLFLKSYPDVGAAMRLLNALIFELLFRQPEGRP